MRKTIFCTADLLLRYWRINRLRKNSSFRRVELALKIFSRWNLFRRSVSGFVLPPGARFHSFQRHFDPLGPRAKLVSQLLMTHSLLWFVKTSRSSKSFLPLGASAYRFVTPARCHSKPRVGARRRRHPRGSDWDNKS